MKIIEIAELVDAHIVAGENMTDKNMEQGFASDLMSDVLTLKTEANLMLITGLANLQTIRTAEMGDITTILFVRGKKVTEEMIELAEENNMILMETKYSMYKVCGILYQSQLLPVY